MEFRTLGSAIYLLFSVISFSILTGFFGVVLRVWFGNDIYGAGEWEIRSLVETERNFYSVQLIEKERPLPMFTSFNTVQQSVLKCLIYVPMLVTGQSASITAIGD